MGADGTPNGADAETSSLEQPTRTFLGLGARGWSAFAFWAGLALVASLVLGLTQMQLARKERARRQAERWPELDRVPWLTVGAPSGLRFVHDGFEYTFTVANSGPTVAESVVVRGQVEFNALEPTEISGLGWTRLRPIASCARIEPGQEQTFIPRFDWKLTEISLEEIASGAARTYFVGTISWRSPLGGKGRSEYCYHVDTRGGDAGDGQLRVSTCPIENEAWFLRSRARPGVELSH